MNVTSLTCASCGYHVEQPAMPDLPELVLAHLLDECPFRFEADVFEREPRWTKHAGRVGMAIEPEVSYEIAWTDDSWGVGRVAVERRESLV